ncbi:hypothetical protein HDU96_007442 [Phlyctochytrium bullatum]|nr:hypothetical protein HDU96_007442 [Phlyctochytrium bullatum]
MGFFNIPKFPTFSEIAKAKAAPINPSIPAPKTWFNLDLRTVLLVLLAISAVLTAVEALLLIPWLWNPFYIILFVFGLVSLLFTAVGFFGVLRLIPEWMIVFAYWLVIYLFLSAVRTVAYAIIGSVVNSLVFFAFRVLYTILMLQCLFALRSYAFACLGLGV